MNSKNAKHRLCSTSTPQKMSHGTLGTANINLAGFLLSSWSEKKRLDGCIFRRITDDGRCSVGIDIVHYRRREFCISQSLVHCHERSFAVFFRCCHVVRVAGAAIAF